MRRMMRPWLVGCITALLLAAPTRADDGFDGALRNLRRAVTPQRNGSHLPRLTALRQLGDPASRALFENLIDHDDWQVQVHAVLALAELSEAKHLDVTLVPDLPALAQEAVIANAIDLDLLGLEQFRELLAADGLTALPRLLIMGELMLRGEDVDDAQLRSWSADSDRRVAAMACSLLAKLGDTGPLVIWGDELSGLASAVRIQNLLLLLEMLRQYDVRPAADWVVSLLASSPHDQVTYRGVLTLIEIDTPRGLRAWREALGEHPPDRRAVRYGMLLLACETSVPAATFDAVTAGNEGDGLLRAMATLGRARSVGTSDEIVDAYIALLGQGHRRSVEWAVLALDDAPPEVARPVYGYLIDRLEDEDSPSPEHTALAVTAAAALGKLRLEDVLDRLRRAEDDGTVQQALLLALFDSDDPRVGRAAAELRRIGSGRADSLVLLLMAKHLAALSDDDLASLGLVASGGGRVSAPLQTQAAWLYLKQTGRLALAIDMILAS